MRRAMSKKKVWICSVSLSGQLSDITCPPSECGNNCDGHCGTLDAPCDAIEYAPVENTCGTCIHWVPAGYQRGPVDLTDDGLCSESQQYRSRTDKCNLGKP